MYKLWKRVRCAGARTGAPRGGRRVPRRLIVRRPVGVTPLCYQRRYRRYQPRGRGDHSRYCSAAHRRSLSRRLERSTREYTLAPDRCTLSRPPRAGAPSVSQGSSAHPFRGTLTATCATFRPARLAAAASVAAVAASLPLGTRIMMIFPTGPTSLKSRPGRGEGSHPRRAGLRVSTLRRACD